MKIPGYQSSNYLAASCNFEYCRETVKINCALPEDIN
jgi:hypothetical protein